MTLLDIQRNLDAAHSMFLSAQQWETYLPSIFSPFTPTSKAHHTHSVKEFFYLSSDIVVEKYFYWENTVGIAPYFALIYLSFLKNFPEVPNDQRESVPSVLAVIIDKMKDNLTLLWKRFEHSLGPLNLILSDTETSALTLLSTLFLAVLVALYLRSNRHRNQPN